MWNTNKLALAVIEELRAHSIELVACSAELSKLCKAVNEQGVRMEVWEGDLNHHLSALVVANASHEELRKWQSALREDGRLLIINKRLPSETSQGFLCAGLHDIRQRNIGRNILTSGRRYNGDALPPEVISMVG
jgi:hypothetical protein